MDLATFKADMKAFLGRDVIPTAIALGNRELSRRISIVQMEKGVVLSALGGDLFTPSDFKSVVALRIKSSSVYLLPTSAERRAATDPYGGPVRYRVGNGKLVIAATPLDGEEFNLTYIANLPDLVANDDTNVGLEHAYEAFVYCVLKHHAKLNRDNNSAASWELAAELAIKALNDADKNNRWRGGTLEIQPSGTVV